MRWSAARNRSAATATDRGARPRPRPPGAATAAAADPFRFFIAVTYTAPSAPLSHSIISLPFSLPPSLFPRAASHREFPTPPPPRKEGRKDWHSLGLLFLLRRRRPLSLA